MHICFFPFYFFMFFFLWAGSVCGFTVWLRRINNEIMDYHYQDGPNLAPAQSQLPGLARRVESERLSGQATNPDIGCHLCGDLALFSCSKCYVQICCKHSRGIISGQWLSGGAQDMAGGSIRCCLDRRECERRHQANVALMQSTPMSKLD